MNNKFIKKFKDSFCELYLIKNLTLISLFVAMFIVITLFSVKISNLCYISFGFIIIALIGWMFGPFVGLVTGFFADILAYNIYPSEDFVLWYAFSVAFDGLIYGMFLYKKDYSLKRIIIVQIFRDILINVIFNTICTSIQYSVNFINLLMFTRIPKNIIKIPINCISIVFVSRLFKKLLKNRNN